MANHDRRKEKALQRPYNRLSEGFFLSYSQIVFPARFLHLWKSSHYARTVPGPKRENPSHFAPASAAGPGPSRGREAPGVPSPKRPFVSSIRARAKRGPKFPPPLALLPGLPPAGQRPCRATTAPSCPARRFGPQSAPNCTYPDTWKKSALMAIFTMRPVANSIPVDAPPPPAKLSTMISSGVLN